MGVFMLALIYKASLAFFREILFAPKQGLELTSWIQLPVTAYTADLCR